MQETRQQIMDAVIDQFNKKGMKFTMDDISKELHISKKTIYKEFNDKDELFFATVDYGFSAIKAKEAEILADDSLELVGYEGVFSPKSINADYRLARNCYLASKYYESGTKEHSYALIVYRTFMWIYGFKLSDSTGFDW